MAWEESIGCLVELQREGEIRWIGISNADSDLIQRAVRLCDVVAGQNELSPAALGGRSELELCERWGITYLPWRPLAGVTGAGPAAAVLADIAAAHAVSPHRVALARSGW